LVPGFLDPDSDILDDTLILLYVPCTVMGIQDSRPKRLFFPFFIVLTDLLKYPALVLFDAKDKKAARQRG